MLFSLETASDYLKDEKASFFGFKCTVIGYEWNSKAEDVRTMFYDLLQCDVQAMLQSFRKRDGVMETGQKLQHFVMFLCTFDNVFVLTRCTFAKEQFVMDFFPLFFLFFFFFLLLL